MPPIAVGGSQPYCLALVLHRGIQEVCFPLGIKYKNFPGSQSIAKSRELVYLGKKTEIMLKREKGNEIRS